MLDSAAVQREVAGAWEPGAGLTLARISYDSVGVKSGVLLLSASLTDEARGRMREVAETHAPERWEARQQIHLFLGDASGPAVRRVERFRGCAPAVVGREVIQRRITDLSRSFAIRQRALVRLWLHVQPDGSVGDIRIDKSSGDSQLDLATARFFREIQFRPGRSRGSHPPSGSPSP